MQPRRRLLKALAATGLLGPAGISGLIRDALAKGDAPIRPGLHKVRGEVVVNRRLATEGQLINPGDTIVTGANSEAIYVIGQDAFMQRELTTVSFGSEAVKNLMRVVSGKILSVFGKGARTIQVSTATIGIRGTGCYIEEENHGARARTYFCLCYGDVELTPTAAPRERETLQHGAPRQADVHTQRHENGEDDGPRRSHQPYRRRTQAARSPGRAHAALLGTGRQEDTDGGGPEILRAQLLSNIGGATLMISAMVVSPAATFFAPAMRSGFMPSRMACSRSLDSSAPSATSFMISADIGMIS